MSKEELEKLEREKYVVERKLTAAMHKEKRLQSELKRLTRSERTHRLCTRAGMLETFLKEPTTLRENSGTPDTGADPQGPCASAVYPCRNAGKFSCLPGRIDR